jgi:hypothetical protein
MGQQRKRSLAAGAALTFGVGGVFAASAPAAKDSGNAAQNAQAAAGNFSLVMMIHTSSGGFGDLPGVKPWGGEKAAGTSFAYRSIPCIGNAPVNNISSDLPSYGTRITGSRAPASMRAHPFAFTLRKNKKTGALEMVGAIKFTVCKLASGATPANDPVPDEEKPKIMVGFRAQFAKMTGELLHWSGRFRIEGGTGRYQDLKGTGQIAGYFMCFAPEGCTAKGGKYLDGQFVMHGNYTDPTPELTTP